MKSDKKSEFLLELYIQMKSRSEAPIVLAPKVERIARTFNIRNPWEVLDDYIKKANEPIFAVVRDRSFVRLTLYGKNEGFSVIKKLITQR